MPIGFVFRGKDRDVIVLGTSLEEAEREYRKNRAAIMRALKPITNLGRSERKSRTSDTTIAGRILELRARSFFKHPKFMSEIIEELKSLDYHYEPSQLTDPLRKLVRSGQLHKAKGRKVGRKSSRWTYCERPRA